VIISRRANNKKNCIDLDQLSPLKTADPGALKKHSRAQSRTGSIGEHSATQCIDVIWCAAAALP
jgi:hypothetical protein